MGWGGGKASRFLQVLIGGSTVSNNKNSIAEFCILCSVQLPLDFFQSLPLLLSIFFLNQRIVCGL